jgi:hypothetical protein
MSEDQSAGTKKKPSSKKKLVRQRAKQTAADQGLDWKGLSKEERRAFEDKIREDRKGSKP